MLLVLMGLTLVVFADNNERKIPKILHYVWVGPKEKPALVQQHIISWKKACPTWEIKEWGDNSTKELNYPFLKEAYAVQKYAFVADFLRVYAVATYGGVYIDSDVELLDSIDFVTKHRFFIGVEQHRRAPYCLGAHFFGAVPDHTIVTDLLKLYKTMHFIERDGTLNQRVIPYRFVDIMKKRYVMPNLSQIIEPYDLADRAVIYPVWAFCNRQPNKKSYAIHKFVGSWDNDIRKVDPKFRYQTHAVMNACICLIKLIIVGSFLTSRLWKRWNC